jgi:hypothetical protein
MIKVLVGWGQVGPRLLSRYGKPDIRWPAFKVNKLILNRAHQEQRRTGEFTPIQQIDRTIAVSAGDA